MFGTISEGLRTARFPAPRAQASGLRRVKRGAFQVPMMPMEPFGWYETYAVAPSWSCSRAGGSR